MGDDERTRGSRPVATGLHEQGDRQAAQYQWLYSTRSRVFAAQKKSGQNPRRAYGSLRIAIDTDKKYATPYICRIVQ